MQHWFPYPINIDPVAVHIGRFGIHWYGISYLLGFLAVGLWMARPEGRRRLGLSIEEVQDFLFYALVGVLVGGRTFFVINDIISKHDLAYYTSNPLNIIAVWQGGMAFHGGLIGVIIASVLFIRKHRPLKFNVLTDEAVMMLPIGIMLTRIVNFINDELWGNVCYPDHPWCMMPRDTTLWGSGFRHPAQIYEAILDILTLPILLWIYKRKPNDGVVAWSWFTIYGITRTIAEFFRQADFVFMGLTGGQLYAIPMIVIGLILLFRCLMHGSRTNETVSA